MMTRDPQREIVDGLNDFANTLEAIADTYAQIAALPILIPAAQARLHAPNVHVTSPACGPSDRAARHARELDRRASQPPTRWEPPC